MTVRDAQRAIEPGSVAHGERGQLESGLSEVLGQQAAQGPPAQGGAAPLQIPEDPIGALLGGEVEGNPDLPTTDGLSVGPGAGAPQTDIAPSMVTPRAEIMRELAETAASPAVRAAARNELRRTLREAL